MRRWQFNRQLSQRARRLDPRLSTVGVMCLIGAVGAGGIEALGVQIPIIDSLVRQALLGALGFALLVASVFTTTREGPVEEIAMSTDRVPLPMKTPRPKLSPRFTGREELLIQVRNALLDQRRLALTGLGGVGKTQLALAYVDRFRAEYDVVWWLRAEDMVSLNDDYLMLAAAHGVPVDAKAEPAQRTEAIRRWLEERDHWLLVFDNVETEALAESYLPQQRTGHVLVTTRNQHWRNAVTVVVPPWRRSESIRFLAPPSDRVNDAHALAAFLGDLPLALDQASSYMQETSTSLHDYLALLRSRTADVLALGSLSNYPRTVASTWLTAIATIRKEMPIARDLLNICSFFTSEGIPHGLLRAWAPEFPRKLRPLHEDRIVYNRAVSILSRYSLLQATPEGVTVHRLVQMLARQSLSPSELRRCAATAVAFAEHTFPRDVAVTEHWASCDIVMPHALAAARHAAQLNLSLQKVVAVYERVGEYLRVQGKFDQALTIFRDAVEVLRRPHDFTSPDLPELLVRVGVVLRATGNLTEARTTLDEAIELEEQSRGPDHPKVAVTLNTAGTVLRGIGNMEHARELHLRALTILEQALGPDHPACATTLNNIGNVQRVMGEAERAVRSHSRAVDIREATLGTCHPDVATSMNNLSNAYADLGDFHAARRCSERAVEIDREVLGSNHPALAADLINYSVILFELGSIEEADQTLEQVLSMNEAVLGANHPDVAVVLNNLAAIRHAVGEPEQAKQLLNRALPIVEATGGPEISAVLHNLGRASVAVGSAAAAEDAFRRSRALQGGDHPRHAPWFLRLDKDVATAEFDVD